VGDDLQGTPPAGDRAGENLLCRHARHGGSQVGDPLIVGGEQVSGAHGLVVPLSRRHVVGILGFVCFRTAGRTLALLRHALRNMEQMRVVGPPQVDQVGPPSRLVALEADPPLLLVGGEILSRGDLPPHEALVVVGGRVDQVADDLLPGPAWGRGAARSRTPRSGRGRPAACARQTAGG
jgi:hypothetical protein